MWARVLGRHTPVAGLNPLRENSIVVSRTIPFVHRYGFCTEDNPDAMDTVPLNSVHEHEPYNLAKSQEQFLVKGNAETETKLRELRLNLYLKRQQGDNLPPEVRLDDIGIMLNLTATKLDRYLSYLCKRHEKSKRDVEAKEKKQDILNAFREERNERMPEEHPWLMYGVFHNSLFNRILKSSTGSLDNALAARGLQFGQKLIIDCSYDSFMTDEEIKITAKQITFSYVSNRKSLRPFSMHVCNLNPDSRLMFYLRRLHPGFDVNASVGIHSRSYLDVFASKNLVYLSPYSKNPFKYNPNNIYIFGGLTEKNAPRRLCLNKAMKEKIRCVSFPLRQHVSFASGGRNSCLHHYFDILLAVKNSGNWSKAITDIAPERKLQGLRNHSS